MEASVRVLWLLRPIWVKTKTRLAKQVLVMDGNGVEGAMA